MRSTSFTMSLGRRWLRGVVHVAFAMVCVLAHCQTSYGQSTFGTVLGTVKDPSGSSVPEAKIDLKNTGIASARALEFQVTEYAPFNPEARATLRLDVGLRLPSQARQIQLTARLTF